MNKFDRYKLIYHTLGYSKFLKKFPPVERNVEIDFLNMLRGYKCLNYVSYFIISNCDVLLHYSESVE